MLAQPYGYPSILSSFAFDLGVGNATGPPSDGNGNTNDVVCAPAMEFASVGQWVCEHREPYIARMVRFRRVVAGTDITGWWDNGLNAIAFSRGDKGFVAINHETSTVTIATTTTLAPGTYCDLLTGGRSGSACLGRTIIVGAGGAVQIQLTTNSAVAIDLESRL
jgi:alpha-amylase